MVLCCGVASRLGLKVPGNVSDTNWDDGASLTSALLPASAVRFRGLWLRIRFNGLLGGGLTLGRCAGPESRAVLAST